MRRIPLTNRNHPGYFAVVDDDDYEWLTVYEWHFRCNRLGGERYAFRKEEGRSIGMHDDIVLPSDGLVVDHLNGDSLDNQKGNLDPCTLGENSRRGQNRRWR